MASIPPIAYNKQKDLLASTTGHFSLLRALHMADYITELNGTTACPLISGPVKLSFREPLGPLGPLR